MSTKTRPGRTTPKGHVPAKRPSPVARKQPHIKAVGSEKHFGGSINGLVIQGDQVIVRCTVDGWLCMCPKDKADWNFDNHVRQAKGLPVQTEQERLEMAIDVTDAQALTNAALDAEVKIDFTRPATEQIPEFRTTIFMTKREYLADPAEAERRGQEQYDNRTEMILNPVVPEPPTREEEIAQIKADLAGLQDRLETLLAQPEPEPMVTEPMVTVPGAVATSEAAPDVVTPEIPTTHPTKGNKP